MHVPVDSAAGGLAAILRGERVDVLVSDGPEGIYGHPDHVHSHRIAVRAAELAGVPTRYEVTVDVRPHIAAKRAAFAAHASQLPDHSSPMQLSADEFAAVYGLEWFNRVGPPGAIDGLRNG